MGIAAKSEKKILVIDDHPMVRDGLRLRVSLQGDMQVCGEAEGMVDAIPLIRQTSPDLIIIDLSLKSGHGIDLIRQIATQYRKIKILVLTIYDESLYAARALRAGAHGYLNKQEAGDRIVEAIRQVLSGKRYFSPKLTDRLLGRAAGADHAQPPSPLEVLSDRELEVFQLIGEGMSANAIAQTLFLSPHTIDSHRDKIRRKLGLAHTAELQRQAFHWVHENGRTAK